MGFLTFLRRRRVARAAVVVLAAWSLSVPALQATQTERVPDSAVVNGVPQGIFVGRSLLTGRSVCLLFLGGGRITRALPEGGLESFDWNRHRSAHSGDSGTWQMRGGQLVVNWGDGGVNEGPVTVHPDSIEFYGKRYAKPVPVSLAAISGRWEAARGTAITGGAGVNRISELTIQADGRYQWGSTVGGVVSGRAVATDRTMTGTVTVRGLTITLTSDAGRATSHTFLPVAGTPVSAFAIGTDMFTRVGPAPEGSSAPPAAPGPPSSSAARGTMPAASYQGLHFTAPNGWTSSMQQGRFMLIPGNATPDSVALVILYGAERLNGRSVDAWLAAKMAADLTDGLKPLQSAPPTRGRSGALESLTAGRTVQDRSGGVILQIYSAISDGEQAGLAMAATASEAAMKTHIGGVQAIFQSLRLSAWTPGPSPTQPPADAAAAPGQKTEITVADVAGSWGHSSASYTEYVNSSGSRTSSTISWGDGYELRLDGTYVYRFTGMVDGRSIKETDTGTWGFEGGNLVIRSKTAGRPPKGYSILGYQVAPDGVAFMTVLDVYYPRNEVNINMWAEKWVKKGK